MQGGRIVQKGAPEEVYCRPASHEVAASSGTPNFIEATVAACRPTDNGDWLVTIAVATDAPARLSRKAPPCR